jgi:hypothetical protein
MQAGAVAALLDWIAKNHTRKKPAKKKTTT